jgi:hypothetical protein
METIIELEIGCEQPVFETILVNPEKILVLPKGYYEKFMDYTISTYHWYSVFSISRYGWLGLVNICINLHIIK